LLNVINTNNNDNDNVYGTVILAKLLREITRFIWWTRNIKTKENAISNGIYRKEQLTDM